MTNIFSVLARVLGSIFRRKHTQANNDMSNFSTNSNTANATTLTGVPSIPQNLIGFDNGNGQASLGWDPLTPFPTSYTIEWATDPAFGMNLLLQIVSSGLHQKVINVGTGQYYFRIKATNSTGDSGWSNVLDLTLN